MYKDHFLDEFTEICPIDYGYQVKKVQIAKQIITLTVIIVAPVILWAGTALGLSISNKGTTKDLKEIQIKHNEQIEYLDECH
jgi:uncharacterized protein YneF (UPF0154 family)